MHTSLEYVRLGDIRSNWTIGKLLLLALYFLAQFIYELLKLFLRFTPQSLARIFLLSLFFLSLYLPLSIPLLHKSFLSNSKMSLFMSLGLCTCYFLSQKNTLAPRSLLPSYSFHSSHFAVYPNDRYMLPHKVNVSLVLPNRFFFFLQR